MVVLSLPSVAKIALDSFRLIDKNADVFVATLAGCLVNFNILDIGVTSFISCFIIVMMDRPPTAGVMVKNQFTNLFNRHGRSEAQCMLQKAG